MLDEEGEVVGGSFLRGLGALTPSPDPALPATVVNQLERQFSSEGDGSSPNERLQSYKEGLARGIEEFLGQNFSMTNFSPPEGVRRCLEEEDFSGVCFLGEEPARRLTDIPTRSVKDKSSSNRADRRNGVDGKRSAGAPVDKSGALPVKEASSRTTAKATDKSSSIVALQPGKGLPDTRVTDQSELRSVAKAPPDKKTRQSGELVSMELLLSHSGGQLVQEFELTREGEHMLEAANGFMLYIDRNRRILFVSDNVSKHLGHQQVHLLGQSIDDYIHPKDKEALIKHFQGDQLVQDSNGEWFERRTFYLGMKFTFQKPNSRAKDTGYSMVQWNVRFRVRNDKSGKGVQIKGLLALCRPVRTDSVLEIRMDGSMFLSRHDLSFHFIYCDPRAVNLVGYEPNDLLGRTAYQFHCPRDILICMQCHKQLIGVGSSTSGYYRFLARTGAWVWLFTHATIIFDTGRKPQYIVCRNYVVSPEEAERELSKEKHGFQRMKCMGFSLETELPLAEPSNPATTRTLAEFTEPVCQDPEMIIDELLTPEPLDISDNGYIRSRKKRKGSRDALLELPPNDSSGPEYMPRLHLSTLGPDGKHRRFTFPHPLDAPKAGQKSITGSGDQPAVTQSAPGQLSGGQPSGALASSGSSAVPQPQAVLSANGGPSKGRVGAGLPRKGLSSVDQLVTSQATNDLSSASDQPQTAIPSGGGSSTAANVLPVNGHLQPISHLSVDQPASTVPMTGLSSFVGQPINTLTTSDYSLLSQPVTTLSATIGRPITIGSADESRMDYSLTFPDPSTASDLRPATNLQSHISTGSSSFPQRQQLSGISLGRMFMNADSQHRSSSMTSQGSLTAMTTVSQVVSTLTSTSEVSPSSVRSNFLLSDSMPPGLDCLLDDSMDISQSLQTVQSVYQSQEPSYDSTKGFSLHSTMSGEKEAVNSLDTFLSMLDNSTAEKDSMPDLQDALTSGHSDPFLNDMSSGFLPDLDLMEEDLTQPSSSAADPLDPVVSTSKNHLDSLSARPSIEPHVTMQEVTAAPLSVASLATSMGDLDSFLNSIPTTTRDNPDSGLVSLPLQEPYSGSELSQSYTESSSDSDSSGRQSLLRTLLDKEANAIEGPLTYKEWIVKQSSLKPKEMRKEKQVESSKPGSSKRARSSRGKKSVELPLPPSASANKGRRLSTDTRRASRELPLPPSALQAGQNKVSKSSSLSEQLLVKAISSVCTESCQPTDHYGDFGLPEDLLDLAMEYGGSLAADQTDALLSELSESANWEDTLYSFIESNNNQSESSHCSTRSELSSSSQTSELSPQNLDSFRTNSDVSSARNPVRQPSFPAKSILSTAISQKETKSTASGAKSMSLLRAAVTSPDMDTLIQQIPLSQQYQLPSLWNGQSSEKMSNGSTCQSQQFKLPHQEKSSPSSFLDQPARSDMASLISAFINKGSKQRGSAQQSPKCCTKPRNSPPTARAKSSSMSTQGSSNQSTPRSPRSSQSSISDHSSTEPVSVMIMRKEHHRSRRSKSIAIQTDSRPGEVYPEFERSPTDTIMYPSPGLASFPSTPSSVDLSSPSTPGMSELERVLRSSSTLHDANAEEDATPRLCGSDAPFLQRLLTGELSKDRYQKLDQQLLEQERTESSGSEDCFH